MLPALSTGLPGPRCTELAEVLCEVECPALTNRRARRAEASGAPSDPICWVEAAGANVRDADGNVLVDLTAGFGAAAFGHRHPPIVAALHAQLDRLVHALGDVHPSDKKVALLRELVALAPFPARAILGISGADALEAALKSALLFTKKPGVIAFEGGYHGLSHGPLAACGYAEGFRAPFAAQLNPHVRFARFPRPDQDLATALESVAQAARALDERAGAILVEPVQGRGGVHVPPPGFLRALSDFARTRGMLLIVDEIYTGLGRTGPVLRHVADGCEADLICLGKALGGGVPISVCLGREAVMAAWGEPGGEAIHTSTFLGNPLSCAAALAFLEQMKREDLGAQMLERGAAMRHALAPLCERHGLSLRGEGLLLGIAFEGPSRVLSVTAKLLAQGYITSPAGSPPSAVCLTPPACITDAQIAGFCAALDTCLGASP
jgi:4-aminobutyrate aminotransferase/(S)-3-amino-2-methylpropionate transaminase